MSELAMYRDQLAQVETALKAAPRDAELQKLAADLRELIAMQLQLAGAQTGGEGLTSVAGWNLGDECEAVSSADGKYYDAIIQAFDKDGVMATVAFEEYELESVVKITSLRKRGAAAVGAAAARTVAAAAKSDQVKLANKINATQAQARREALKVKARKRKEKEEEMRKVHEDQKSKWQSFNKKASVKSKSGFATGKPRGSIFATPESLDGRVGVGTCGIGGKAMTQFQNRGKWEFEAGEGEEGE